LIQFTNVTKHFKKNWAVLENITFSIDRGEFVFVTGKSGAGKSTLLNHMYMKLLPTSGEVVVDSFSSCLARKKEIALLRRKVGMIFQEFLLLNVRHLLDVLYRLDRLDGGRPVIVNEQEGPVPFSGIHEGENDMFSRLAALPVDDLLDFHLKLAV